MSSWLEWHRRRQRKRLRTWLLTVGCLLMLGLGLWLSVVPNGIMEQLFPVALGTAVAPMPSVNTLRWRASSTRGNPAGRLGDNPDFVRVREAYWQSLSEQVDREEVAVAEARLERLRVVIDGEQAQKRPATPRGTSIVKVAAGSGAKPERRSTLVEPASPRVAISRIGATALPLGRTGGPPLLALPQPAVPSEVDWFESCLPVLIRTFEDRLAERIALSKKQSMTIRYTDGEFQLSVVRRLLDRYPKQISTMTTVFRNNSVEGFGIVSFSKVGVPIAFRMGFAVVEGRPHPILYELKLDRFAVAGPLLKLMESRVCAVIDRDRLPLKIQWIQLGNGWARVSAELLF